MAIFYPKDSISILFSIYDSHNNSFIRVSITNYASSNMQLGIEMGISDATSKTRYFKKK